MRTIIFGYDFPHKKTQDILLSSINNGMDVCALIGAPKRILPTYATALGYHPLPQSSAMSPSVLCGRLGVPYYAITHDQVEEIAKIVSETRATVGVIGGARILSQAVINLFLGGIVNYHPGKIPETSGLDSFYWMLEKNSPPQVTAHLIDFRVDAGQLILSYPIKLVGEDTPATVSYKLYTAQISAHDKVCERLNSGQLMTEELFRKEKNSPMSDAMRISAISKFSAWKEYWMENAFD